METDRTNIQIQMEGEFRVRNLDAIRERLLSLVAADLQFELDLGDVSEFDTAGLQLLLSLRKELQKRNGSLIVVKASEPVMRLMSFYCLEGLLVAGGGANE